jgi:hypothetical protein
MVRVVDTRRSGAVLALAILTTLSIDFASARSYDRRIFGQPWFATAGGVLLGVLAILWLRAPRGLSIKSSWARWLGALPIVTAMASIYARGLLEPGPTSAFEAISVAGVGIMVVGTLAGRTPLLLAGALASGVAIRAFEFNLVPINPGWGDMLPLVLLAITSAAGGESPYRVYHLPWSVPLTYMPLGWLAYAPLFLARVDPRWTNTLAEVSVLSAVYFCGRKRRDKTWRDAAATLWAAWFVASRIVKYDSGVAAQVQWAAIAWLAALAVEKNRWTPAAFGAALGTTVLALPLAPTLAIAWHRAWSRPLSPHPRRARAFPLARAIMFATLVGAELTVPWVIWSPRAFFDGVVLWFNDIDRFPSWKWAETREWTLHPGLAGIFWTLHFERWMKPLQIALIAGLAIVYARKTAAKGPRDTLGPELVGVFLLFILFNPMVWSYLWEPSLGLALVALASARTEAVTR